MYKNTQFALTGFHHLQTAAKHETGMSPRYPEVYRYAQNGSNGFYKTVLRLSRVLKANINSILSRM